MAENSLYTRNKVRQEMSDLLSRNTCISLEEISKKIQDKIKEFRSQSPSCNGDGGNLILCNDDNDDYNVDGYGKHEKNDEDSESDDDGDDCNDFPPPVTPLMVICDKLLLEVFLFLNTELQKLRGELKRDCPSCFESVNETVDIFGHPLDHSHSIELGGNQAIHILAAQNECGKSRKMLDALTEYTRLTIGATYFDDDDDDEDCDIYEKLGSQININGDTPVMMACAKGNLPFLKRLIQSVQLSSGTPDTTTAVDNLLCARNRQGLNCITLAFGHARKEIVNYILQKSGNSILRQDPSEDHVLIQCKRILKSVERRISEVQNFSSPYSHKEYKNTLEESFGCDVKTQIFNMRNCLQIIENASEIISKKREEELLNSLALDDNFEGSTTANNNNGGKAAKKKKKKKKKNNNNRTSSPLPLETVDHRNATKTKSENGVTNTAKKNNDTSVSDDDDHDHEEKKAQDEEKITNPPITSSVFTTLSDGSVVKETDRTSIPQSTSSDYYDHPTTHNNKNKNNSMSTLKSMLHDRCLTSTSSKISNNTINGNTNNNNDTSSSSPSLPFADSLCLDMSMLLLTPHGYAMKLSPAQLEAVEKLLRTQLDAVNEAKEIQNRLLRM